jgi:hypothetical protein
VATLLLLELFIIGQGQRFPRLKNMDVKPIIVFLNVGLIFANTGDGLSWTAGRQAAASSTMLFYVLN